MVRWTPISSGCPGWFGWSGWYPCHLVDWIGQVDINADDVVRWTAFSSDWPGWFEWTTMSSVWPTWPDWSSEHQCQLAGWVTWVSDLSTFLVGWPGQVTLGDRKSCVTGEHYCQLVGLVGQVNIFVDDMVRWTASPSWPVWLGELHCQMSGLVDSSFTWLVRWAPLSMVWLFNQQLCMVGLVCQVNSSFTCLAYLVEWTALWWQGQVDSNVKGVVWWTWLSHLGDG